MIELATCLTLLAVHVPEDVRYDVCVPWVNHARPQSWDEVIAYYSDQPFTLPGELRLLPPVPREISGLVTNSSSVVNGADNATEPSGRGPRTLKRQSQGDWGSLDSQVVIQDARPGLSWEDPLLRRQWQTDEAWRYAVLGPISVYGQFGAATEEAQQKDAKVAGKTGLAWCLPTPIPQSALTLRSGPSVSYTDAMRPERMRERAEWLLEVEGRLPLIAGIGLEFQGTALPALNPLDHDRVLQDLRLAFPVGTNGKLKVGAKRQWETTSDSRVLNESSQLYLGLELTR
jgi:hypothetical protein